MFTLKLFRAGREGGLVSKILAVHHVQTHEIGEDGHTLSMWAFHHAEPSGYDSFTIGERLPPSEAAPMFIVGGYDDHHWEWGLLENWEGNTSQHFRPHSYGLVPPYRKAA